MEVLTHSIGPTINQELMDAGLTHIPYFFTIDPDTKTFTGEIHAEFASDADRTAFLAVLNAHDPATPDWSVVRAERNQRLMHSDWTQVADAPVDQVAWASYRTALRDLPTAFAHPDDVIWPVPPS